MSSTGVSQCFSYFLIFSRLLTVPNLPFGNTEVDVSRPGISKSAPLLKISFLNHLSRCEILILEARSRCKMTAWSHTFKCIYARLLNRSINASESKNVGRGERAPPPVLPMWNVAL